MAFRFQFHWNTTKKKKQFFPSSLSSTLFSINYRKWISDFFQCNKHKNSTNFDQVDDGFQRLWVREVNESNFNSSYLTTISCLLEKYVTRWKEEMSREWKRKKTWKHTNWTIEMVTEDNFQFFRSFLCFFSAFNLLHLFVKVFKA
jgi:hypothetical protein